MTAVTLPARWGRGQRLKNTLLYGCIRAAFALAERVPFTLLRWSGPAIAFVLSVLAIGSNRRTRAHLQRALPSTNPRDQRGLVRQMWRHLWLCAAELTHLRMMLTRERVVFAPGVRELFERVLVGGKGAVVATGHIGNWELMAQAVAARYPVSTVARPLYDPRLTRWVNDLRSGGDLEIIWRDRRTPMATALHMRRALKRGRLLALLVDQNTRVPSRDVPFLDRPAPTPTAPAALALRSGAPLLVAWTHREGDKHVVHARSIELPPSQSDDHARVDALLAAVNDALSAAIRAQPAQWVWMHRRWN